MRSSSGVLKFATTLLSGVVLSFIFSVPGTAQSEVTIEKSTNGQDADVAPGPVLVAGDPVTWTYQVSSSNGRALFNIVVSDDQGLVVSCPTTSLAAGASMICTASGTAEEGPYENLGTVDAELQNGTPVSDTDPSHYFGTSAPSVTLEKSTEGFDADTPPGPSLPVGSTVNWTYEVTNIGAETLMEVMVTDDHGVSVSCPGSTLAPNASMTCTASGSVQLGQYTNIGTVMASTPSEDPVAASDPSHYYGQTLILQKRTNGFDADSPPGPKLSPGDPVTWTYEVSNPGPAAVTNLQVVDDQLGAVSCPQSTIAAGETVVCSANGTVQLGQYANLGTATAELPLGGSVSDTDPSHYFGTTIAIEKATNGQDADSPPGPTLLIGAPVTWTYMVTNFDTDPVTNVAVTDDQGVTVTCPKTTLVGGESMTCTADGTAGAGQYENVGTVTADGGGEGALADSDTSHYFGEEPMPDVSATKSVALTDDADASGGATAGDTLTYTVAITNDGTGDATMVMLSDAPDVNTTLVTGSAATTQGTVTTGNGGGDTSVVVDVGTLAAGGGSVVITFQVTVNDPVPAGVMQISNQGTVSGGNFATEPTDDPGQPGTDDPTVVAVGNAPPPPAVIEVPTLDRWALLALLLLLAGAAVVKLSAPR